MTVPLIFACDNRYAMPTAVAMVSLIRNRRPETCYAIHILGNDLAAEHRSTLLGMACEGVTVEVMDVHDKYRAHIRQLNHITTTTLYRYELGDLFPAYDKLIYLDGDIIIQEDLGSLFATDLGGRYGAGVRQLNIRDLGWHPEEPSPRMFYAGVFVANAKRMREEEMARKLFEYTKTRNVGPNDQLVMNEVFGDQVLYLSPTFNYCNVNDMLCAPEEGARHYDLAVDEWRRVQRRPTIIHYIDGKPWDYYFCLRAGIWRQYFRQSPYAGMKLSYRRSGKLFAVWLLHALLPRGRGRTTIRKLYFRMRREG